MHAPIQEVILCHIKKHVPPVYPIIQGEYEFVERYCADFAEGKYQDHLRAKGPDSATYLLPLSILLMLSRSIGIPIS